MATLLYVDDEEVIGMVVSRFFAMRGEVVRLARNLSQAKSAIESEEPDVIFLDVWLGAENGADLVVWLAETRPHLQGRVTFVTGEPEGPTSPAWMRFGCPVIRKPFDLDTLAAAVTAAENRSGT